MPSAGCERTGVNHPDLLVAGTLLGGRRPARRRGGAVDQALPPRGGRPLRRSHRAAARRARRVDAIPSPPPPSAPSGRRAC